MPDKLKTTETKRHVRITRRCPKDSAKNEYKEEKSGDLCVLWYKAWRERTLASGHDLHIVRE